MNLIYNLEENIDITKNTIFLAGPTSRTDCSNSWRKKAIEYLNNHNFDGNIIIPEPRDNIFNRDTFNKVKQIEWERKWLHYSNVILFWVDRGEDLPGLTTNIEFGEWFKSNKVFVGFPPESCKNDYINYLIGSNKTLSDRYSHRLDEMINKIINNFNRIGKDWFISDTHIGQQRTLDLSKRPYNNLEEMDYTIVSNWNSLIYSQDTVNHLGDFGEPKYIKYLTGKNINLLVGNYDNDDFINQLKLYDTEDRVNIIKEKRFHYTSDLVLIHEPENKYEHNDYPNCFYLYGHVHQLSKVKRNGLNVGVDCHNFKPIDLSTIEFYKNAINNFYDNNVFMNSLEHK